MSAREVLQEYIRVYGNGYFALYEENPAWDRPAYFAVHPESEEEYITSIISADEMNDVRRAA